MARWLIGFDLVDEDPERLEELTRMLLTELRELGEVRVDRVEGSVSEGAKSGLALQVGSLAISGVFSAATAAAFAKVMVARFDRAKARKVTLEKDGEKVEIDGISAADQHVLVAKIAEHLGEPGRAEGAAEQR